MTEQLTEEQIEEWLRIGLIREASPTIDDGGDSDTTVELDDVPMDQLTDDGTDKEMQKETPKEEQKREVGGVMLDWVYDELLKRAEEGEGFEEHEIEEELVHDL